MFTINLQQILTAFSLALDVAENKSMKHAQRTAFIALELAQNMSLPASTQRDIYIAALLHDIGFTHARANLHADLSQLVSHCRQGAEIVKTLSFISPEVVENIAWHHANWDGSGLFERQGKEIPLGAQIVYAADQLELQLRQINSIYTDRIKVVAYAKENAGTQFNPEVVEAFLAVQSKEKFWLDYTTDNTKETTLFRESPCMLGLKDLEEIAAVFTNIIDNKSPFTRRHSQSVADLAERLGRFYNFDEETIRKIKISGLLHDLGKLAIPNEIIDKPDKLTQTEYLLVMGHAYYTKLILSQIEGFEDIAEWAGNHHEALNGTGYPQGIAGKALSVQARIMAVCDVYVALTEERPYRSRSFTTSEVNEIMNDQVKAGKLCPKVLRKFNQCMVG